MGIQAELIAVQVDGFLVQPSLIYEAQVSFDYKGLQWDIKASSEIDMADTVRADFDHVFQTLKILD